MSLHAYSTHTSFKSRYQLSPRQRAFLPLPVLPQRRSKAQVKRIRRHAYKVEIEHAGGTTSFDVDEGSTVLETALEHGLELSHDCKMGVCMTCPAKLVSGQVDQSAGMLDEEVREKGYALLCVSEPRSDCRIKVIDELDTLDFVQDEILEQVLDRQ